MELAAKWTMKGIVVRPVSDDPIRVRGITTGDVLFEGMAGLSPIAMPHDAVREDLIVEPIN